MKAKQIDAVQTDQPPKKPTKKSPNLVAMDRKSLSFGPVVIEDWFDEPRIGHYDDDTEDDDDEPCAVVYPGDLFLAIPVGYYVIPYEFLREVTTQDLCI